MADLAELETARADALLIAPAEPHAEGVATAEAERLPRRTPRTSAAALAKRLALAPDALAGATPGLFAQLQADYGNAYALELIARLRAQREPHARETGGPAVEEDAPVPEPAPATPAAAPAPAAPQLKAVVSTPGDAYEREADAVAASVVSGSSMPQISSVTGDTLARTADYEKKRTPPEGEKQPVQTADGGEVTPEITDAASAAISSPGPGAPMQPSTRGALETHLQTDLSDVRVHDDATAQRQAASIGARAFTHGNDIWLGGGESQSDMSLMAHETTHVVQQRSGAVQRRNMVQRLIPDFILEGLADYARHIPGWSLFIVILGFNPLTREDVPRTAINLLAGVMGLVPFGTMIFDALNERGIIQDAFTWVEGELSRLDLSLSRIERTLGAAWDDVRLIEGFDYNLAVLVRHFRALYNDVVSFAQSLVDHIMQMIKEAVIGVAEELLAENRAWALIKKILGHDPLRDVPVTATPAEILEDFLLLIGKQQHLEQMKERGTLEETANWLATQIATFLGLLGELRGLISRAWDAIQPQNLPSLVSNLRALATDVGGFLQRVWDFATNVAAKVLELIKKALLDWLSSFAHELPGFHLLTVIIGRNPFTGEAVPLTAENLMRGFITLLPNGQQIYTQLAESGAIAGAAARIEGALASLGINWDFIVGLFTGLWNSLSIEDLLSPIDAFTRIVERFGEPISRLFQFIGVVLRETIFIILQMMNFPFDLIGSIVSNAMAAIEDIKRDPIAFLKNMLAAVKLGFTNFFDNILTHLLGGLADWLFRGLRSAGIEPPTDLTLSSVLGFVLNVLGISMDRIWEKLAQRIGQETVDRIRGAIDRLVGIWNFIRDVQERGVVAIWEYIESQISNLWNMVLEKAKEWIMERIINRAIQWLLSLLDVTGIMPVINSFIAFFNAVQSAIEYLRDILAIVNDYVTTVAAVARGEIQPGATKMERGLANAIPIAIGFLANQFGFGNIGEKIAEILAGVRALIDQALDWLIDRAVSTVQSLLATLGFGGEEPGTEAAVEGDTVEIHTTFELEGGEDHEIKNREGQNVLVLSSSTPTLLDQHPDEDVRDAYATYLRAIAEATSPTGKREAANRNLRIIVNKIKAAGSASAPGASAPGIGTVDRHKNQQSRLTRTSVAVWHMESEHVMPRAFVDAAFAALAQAGVAAGGADYNNMNTILIYEGAADLKTEGPFGDQSTINDFKNTIAEIVHAVFGTRQRNPGAARAEMAGVTLRLLNAFAAEAEGRTNMAIQGENQTNGAARGPEGTPEPPTPRPAQVRSAYTAQRNDINEQLSQRINSFLDRRAAEVE